LIKAAFDVALSSTIANAPNDSAAMPFTVTETFFHSRPTWPNDDVRSSVNGAQAGMCIGARISTSGNVFSSETIKRTVSEVVAFSSVSAALGAIRPGNTVIESPGSKVDALFKVMTRCRESLQKQLVDDAPENERSLLHAKTRLCNPAKLVYESNLMTTS
jgi:hypothetical protein